MKPLWQWLIASQLLSQLPPAGSSSQSVSSTMTLEQLQTSYQQQMYPCDGLVGWIAPASAGTSGQVVLQRAEMVDDGGGQGSRTWRKKQQFIALTGPMLPELAKLTRSLVCIRGQTTSAPYHVTDYQLLLLRDKLALVGQVRFDEQQRMIWSYEQQNYQLHQAASIHQLLKRGCQPKVWLLPERLVFPVLYLGAYGILLENCPSPADKVNPAIQVNATTSQQQEK